MKRLSTLSLLLLVAGCVDAGLEPAADVTGPSAAVVEAGPNAVDLFNDALAVQGSEYRIAYAEYLTADADEVTPHILIARDLGNRRLSLDFIPDDPRRGGPDGDPNNIDVVVDLIDGNTASGLDYVATTTAIARAMTTWDDQTCSNLGGVFTPAPVDLGLVQAAAGFGGGFVVSDIMHAGWLPGDFFDLLRPNGSQSILGVTFSLIFTSGDLDGNGLPDLGAREIYYNDAFPWADDGSSNFDVETVALHEAGHGLSQAHFGTVRINQASGKLIFSPRAVMNAVYSGVNRTIEGTDEAGHCSIWGNWPEATPFF